MRSDRPLRQELNAEQGAEAERIFERLGAAFDQERMRVARLMALAIHCDQLIRNSVVADQAELARFDSISTFRMTQIMSLLNLAPDIQEQILFLPRKQRGHDVVQEADVRPIASEFDWRKQRRMWAALQRAVLNTDASSR